MPCYSPLRGYAARHVNPTGKRSIVFNRSAGFADKPIDIPCGVCIGCRIQKSREWALRCVHEAKLHPTNCFITLTYDDSHLPPGGSLDKCELQKFFKRLRHYIGPFRYFACGEYGDESKRPHYHAILFGVDFAGDRRRHSKNARGDATYISPTLTEAWGLGHCIIGGFTYQSAAYVARYVMKKRTGEQEKDYERIDVPSGLIYLVDKEFCLMSRRPGIGHDWYQKFHKDAFPSDFLVHQGKKHSVPRYYYEKLKKQNEVLSKEIKFKRKKSIQVNASDNTADRLYVKEEVKKAQLSQLKRSL